MRRFLAVLVLVTVTATAGASASTICDNENLTAELMKQCWEPNPETIRGFSSEFFQGLLGKKMSERQIANQLASDIIWLEKVQLICPSYYYVNARVARFQYLLYQGAWSHLFDGGKTSTELMNIASAKRNEEFNNSVSKKKWCEDIKEFGLKTLGWDYEIFEKGKK